ncbi:MAG TPA: murein L,D-transpeptidase catalytic domain family protein [Mucilaginibacter sp.]|nr:murein L,D-transpeptidase catalytic domain family protein [Mucilaginibacter sp.]
MKSYLKYIIICLFLCVTAFAYASTPRIDINRTRQKATQALLFSRQHGYNIKYCILVDMSQPSGLKRFMVWDFKKDDTLFSGLVSHGCGLNPWSGVWSKDKPAFSNVVNSHCSSLGKYVVGLRSASAWGIHIRYELHGLESTNSNAYARTIVLHSWEQVPDKEIYPDGTPEDWGCPAVSNNTMKLVDALIRYQKKYLLLWIYN